jgi:hypothetical protein
MSFNEFIKANPQADTTALELEIDLMIYMG